MFDTPENSQEVLETLSKPYGCYGIKTIDGFGVWLDEWQKNDGAPEPLKDLFMIINSDTHHFTLWSTLEIIDE